MLIAKFLREVDAELERLQTARATIAALIAGPSTEQPTASAPWDTPGGVEALLVAGPAQEPVVVQVVPARRRGRPKGSRNRFPRAARAHARHVPEPTALSSAVVKGPVFVSAAELERRRRQAVVIAAPAPEPVVHEGTLESLIRAVRERRGSAAA